MALACFWITFPDGPDTFPIGLGVTARSREDAFALVEAQGLDFHVRAPRVEVNVCSRVEDLPAFVRAHMGPPVVRGVWYPCLNVGFGAPR